MTVSKMRSRIGAVACAFAVVTMLVMASGAAAAGGGGGGKGATGPTGPTGATGPTGPAGGPPGPTGLAGANGTNGANGANGTNGLTGATGPTGAVGANGSNGSGPACEHVNPGCQGANGTNGANGSNGIVGANGTNGVNGVNGANGTNGEKGATGPAGPPNGPTGATGPAGEKGATGAAGTEKNAAACKEGKPVESCTLASGYQETGVWSVHIAAPTGAPQQQYESPISFPVRLKKGDLVKATYRTSFQSEEPALPCLGSVEEPIAQAGNLCVYRGYGDHGGLETQDHNAAFFALVSPNGENIIISGKVGALGERVVFRSVNNSPSFKEEPAEAPGVITEMAYMEGGGSWAVQEK